MLVYHSFRFLMFLTFTNVFHPMLQQVKSKNSSRVLQMVGGTDVGCEMRLFSSVCCFQYRFVVCFISHAVSFCFPKTHRFEQRLGTLSFNFTCFGCTSQTWLEFCILFRRFHSLVAKGTIRLKLSC